MRKNKVTKRLTKKDVLTIPNLLSMVRLLIIPFICYVYLKKGNKTLALILTVISGLTDIADGIIARKFNMISDLGKFLDPVADKLTQFALIICLMIKHKQFIVVIIALLLRELSMFIMGAIVLKETDVMYSAKWYGKLSTVVVYATIILMLFLPKITRALETILILASLAVIINSFVLYMIRFARILIKHKKSKKTEAE